MSNNKNFDIIIQPTFSEIFFIKIPDKPDKTNKSKNENIFKVINVSNSITEILQNTLENGDAVSVSTLPDRSDAVSIEELDKKTRPKKLSELSKNDFEANWLDNAEYFCEDLLDFVIPDDLDINDPRDDFVINNKAETENFISTLDENRDMYLDMLTNQLDSFTVEFSSSELVAKPTLRKFSESPKHEITNNAKVADKVTGQEKIKKK